jgi:hypothetical protein
MMRLLTLSFILNLICFVSGKAQPDPVEWGRLSPSDLRLYKYEHDTSIPALILCDYGKLSVEVIGNEYKIVLRRFKRIKIFSKSAYNEANIEILYNRSEKEYPADIRAESISPIDKDGSQVTVLKDADILDKEIDEHWSKRVFAIPGITEGSVIEYSYSLVSSNFFNYHSWSFQSQLPCLWSELRAELSGVYNYMVLLHNVDNSLFINEKTEEWKTVPDQIVSNTSIKIPIRVKSTSGRYVMKDIPPLVEEPFLTSIQDYRKEIRFQLYSISKPYSGQQKIISSWPELVQRLNTDHSFGEWIKPNQQLRDLTNQIIKDKTGSESRLRAIYDYIRTHFRWNKEYGLLAKSSPEQVLKQQNGNSAELNLLMNFMLKLAGLNSSPVIISTRSHGRVQKDFPILNQFNHVICAVKCDSATYLLDVIDPFRPFNLLSIEDLNSTGLAIDGNNYHWTTLQNPFPTKRSTLLTLKVDSSGNIKGDMVINETGHFAHARRSILNELEKGKVADYLLSFFSIDLSVDTMSILNLNEIELPLKICISFSARKAIDFMFQKDVIYFDAMISTSMKINPFKQSTRNYPVNFNFPYEESSILVVQIPKGYIFVELPHEEHFVVPDENAEFQFQVFNTTKIFQVKSLIKIKKSTFPVDEYSDLKSLFELMVRKNSEQVTAVRKR